MNVYVLKQDHGHEGEETIAVYTTRALAEQALADFEDQASWRADNYLIEEEPVIDDAPIPVEHAYDIRLDRDGTHPWWERTDHLPPTGWSLLDHRDVYSVSRTPDRKVLRGIWRGATAQDAVAQAQTVRQAYRDCGEWPEEQPSMMERMLATLPSVSTPFIETMPTFGRTITFGHAPLHDIDPDIIGVDVDGNDVRRSGQ